MKFVPITVVIPGSSFDRSESFTPTEARTLMKRLQRELEIYTATKNMYGAKKARQHMAKRYARMGL